MLRLQPGTLADLLGGKERIDGARQNIGFHAVSGVANRQHGVGAGRQLRLGGRRVLADDGAGGLHRQGAAIGHGVLRVDRERQNDGLELGRVYLYRQ